MSRRGDWSRASIARDRARIARADAERAERVAHHTKYGDRFTTGELYPFECCGCWGCVGSVVGTECEGQE